MKLKRRKIKDMKDKTGTGIRIKILRNYIKVIAKQTFNNVKRKNILYL